MKINNLTVELVPKTCWWSSVRSMVTITEWNKIRKLSYASANNKCEICGSDGLKQGYKHRVECHEVFEYDDINHIQKLVKLISLCVNCHQVKHIGRAIAMGRQVICLKHLAKVNNWSQKEIQDHIIASFETNKERSKHQWTLDISLLKLEPYNIIIKENTERVFKVIKHKKKKKPKIAGANKKIHPKAKIGLILKKKPNKKP